jgi:sulfur carrier protein ThiS
MEYSHSLWLNWNMTAKITLRTKEYEIKHGMTIRMALQKLSIDPDSVLATRNGDLLTDDEIVKEDDLIKLVPVISGG